MSKTNSKDTGQNIARPLKIDTIAHLSISAFKFWVKQHAYQLISYSPLNLQNFPCFSAKKQVGDAFLRTFKNGQKRQFNFKNWLAITQFLIYSSAQPQVYNRVQGTCECTARTVPLRRNLTCVCERLVSYATSHASVICARAQVHASGALPTHESKLASVLEANHARVLASTRKRTREYSQTNSRVLANGLGSTRKRTREVLATNTRVPAKEMWTILRAIHNRTCTKGFHCHPRSSDNHGLYLVIPYR